MYTALRFHISDKRATPLKYNIELVSFLYTVYASIYEVSINFSTDTNGFIVWKDDLSLKKLSKQKTMMNWFPKMSFYIPAILEMHSSSANCSSKIGQFHNLKKISSVKCIAFIFLV